MRNAVADIPVPEVEKPNAFSSSMLAQEAQGAIRRAFPCEGDLRVRYLWSTDGGSRFRANWFREVDGKTMIVKSLLLCVTRAEDGLVAQDETAVR